MITGKLVNDCDMIVRFAKAVRNSSSAAAHAEAVDFLGGPWTLTPLKKRNGQPAENPHKAANSSRKGPSFKTVSIWTNHITTEST